LTKQAYEAARKNVELVKIEEQEEIVTMWLCPMCKVYMKPDQGVCINCDKQIQYFENKLRISLETMFV
jgi:rubrerythrin